MTRDNPTGRSKIAVDVHVIEGRPQGSRTTLTNLLREVAALGRAGDFALYCSDPALCRERIGVDGFDYFTIPQGGSIKRLLWTLPRALAKQRAEKALWQYICAPLYRGQNFVVIHDVLPFTHAELFPLGFRVRCQILFTLSMFRAEKVIVVSEFSRASVAELFPRLANKLVVIPNGPSYPVDTYFQVKPVTSPRHRPYVLTVGRVEKRKNITMLARAFVAADLSDVDLIIVGQRDLGFSASLPERFNVINLQGVGEEELIALYRNASLFVFPSAAEGFGIPLLDSLLFGVPTIASSLTAMEEIGTGLAELFDPTAPNADEALALLIRGHFCGTPIEAPSFTQRQSHAERFNWQVSASTLVGLLS